MPNLRLLKRTAEQRYTLAVVYEPNVADTHDDFAKADTIREAAWTFMRQLQNSRALRREVTKVVKALLEASKQELAVDITDLAEAVQKGAVGDMHEDFDDANGEIVESFVAPVDLQVGDEVVKAGTWCVGIVWSEALFEKIKRGDRTGVSMGGTALRLETSRAA